MYLLAGNTFGAWTLPAIILYEYFLMKYDLEKISLVIDFIDAYNYFLNPYTYQSHLWSDSSLQIW